MRGPDCGKEFPAKRKAVTCSPECSLKRGLERQRERRHANLELVRAYKRKYRAANRAKINAQERKRWHAKKQANVARAKQLRR